VTAGEVPSAAPKDGDDAGELGVSLASSFTVLWLVELFFPSSLPRVTPNVIAITTAATRKEARATIFHFWLLLVVVAAVLALEAGAADGDGSGASTATGAGFSGSLGRVLSSLIIVELFWLNCDESTVVNVREFGRQARSDKVLHDHLHQSLQTQRASTRESSSWS
jgi:hypothetical protein